MNRRMKESLIGGTILGIICVIGAYIRSCSNASPVFVFSLWYNRVIIRLGNRHALEWNGENQITASWGISGLCGVLCFLQLNRISRSHKFCGWEFLMGNNQKMAKWIQKIKGLLQFNLPEILL